MPVRLRVAVAVGLLATLVPGLGLPAWPTVPGAPRGFGFDAYATTARLVLQPPSLAPRSEWTRHRDPEVLKKLVTSLHLVLKS
jgi:hypothetical protein